MMKILRKIRPRLGLGKKWTHFQKLRNLGFGKVLQMEKSKRFYLPRIQKAAPIEASEGIEVHLLLHHKKVHEGLWALYSLAFHAERPCHFVIHDDGSLLPQDIALLQKMLPGCSIVTRAEADARVMSYFEEHGLKRCAHLRQSLVLGLKLFDPAFFTSSQKYIVMDSDVLFFDCPRALFDSLENTPQTPPRYSLDVADSYCLSEDEMVVALGKEPIYRCNSGLFSVQASLFDLRRIETHLEHKAFWNREDGRGHYFAEQTLWAMELSMQNAVSLPENYALCYHQKFVVPDLASGHFCGGLSANFAYYTVALPQVSATILKNT